MSLIVAPLGLPAHSVDTAGMSRIAETFTYERQGYDKTTITLKPDGSIEGAGSRERYWVLLSTGGVAIYGSPRNQPHVVQKTADMELDSEGIWVGAWLVREKMPVTLTPTDGEVAAVVCSVPVKMFGLQRSCTNLTLKLLTTNLDVRSTEKGTEWKHGFCKQFPRKHDGDDVKLMVCLKDPYAWLFSMYRMCSKGLDPKHTLKRSGFKRAWTFSDFLRNPHYSLDTPMHRWMSLYDHWVGLHEQYPQDVFLIRSDSLQTADGQAAMVTTIAEALGLQVPDTIKTFDKYIGICMRPKAHNQARSWYNGKEYLKEYTVEDLEHVSSIIPDDFMERAGYVKEEAP